MIESISKFPMKRFTQPWRPCRNLGTQHVGNAACSPRPEVVIAARVIPAPSPRWTFRGKGGHNAGLPTCRLGRGGRWGDTACFLNSCLGASVSNPMQLRGGGFRRKLRLQQLSKRLLRCLRQPSSTTRQGPLPTGNSEEPKIFNYVLLFLTISQPLFD